MTEKGKAGNKRRCNRWRAKNRKKYNEYMKKYMRSRRK